MPVDLAQFTFSHPQVIQSEILHACPAWISPDQPLCPDDLRARLKEVEMRDQELVQRSRAFWNWTIGTALPLPGLCSYQIDGPFHPILDLVQLVYKRNQIAEILASHKASPDLGVLVYAYRDEMSWSAALALLDFGLKNIFWTSYERIWQKFDK